MGNGFTDHLKAKGLETITKQNETQLVTYSGQHHASSSGPDVHLCLGDVAEVSVLIL